MGVVPVSLAEKISDSRDPYFRYEASSDNGNTSAPKNPQSTTENPKGKKKEMKKKSAGR